MNEKSSKASPAMPPDSQASLVLQADSFDLWGSRLIEASAGTGKTWTIAALYLRLVWARVRTWLCPPIAPLGNSGDDLYPGPRRANCLTGSGTG